MLCLVLPRANIRQSILDSFCTDAQDYLGSFASKFLAVTSTYLLFLPFQYDREVDKFLRKSCTFTQNVPDALRTLTSLTADDYPKDEDEDETLEDDDFQELGGFLKSKQRQRKKAKRVDKTKRPAPIDHAALDRLGMGMPISQEETAQAIRTILEDQRVILEVCSSHVHDAAS